VYAAYQGKVPAVFRCYQVQPVWRADTPGKGRFREFYQCDADVVGSASRLAETELLAASSECLQKLGFGDFTLRLNHRGLLRAIVELCGVPSAREIDAIIAIDKLDKVGRDGVDDELSRKGIAGDSRKQLLDIISERASLEHVGKAVANGEKGRAAVDDIRTVIDLCQATPAAGRVAFDISLARGLDYYTGCIYEAEAPGLASSLGGGGRYDQLVGSFLGKPVPACGFSLGLERILGVMEERGHFPGLPAPVDAVLAAVAEDDLEEALRLSQRLRARGLKVELSTRTLKPGKLRKQADGRGLPFAIWLEPDAKGRASLWKREDGTITADMGFDSLVEVLGITP
jgi:histidyl-tRNA synthetase